MSIELRDEILQPYVCNGPELGDVYRFSRVPRDVLEKLIFHGFVHLGRWNNCAGVQDLFLPFLAKHPHFTAHGFAITKARQDCRLIVEGIECDVPLTIETVIDFANTFRKAEDFSLSASHARCWYD
jgi:hypothetical protein